MTRLVHIWCDCPIDDVAATAKRFGFANAKIERHAWGGVRVVVSGSNSRWQELADWAKASDPDCICKQEIKYDRQDLESAALLEVRFGTAPSLDSYRNGRSDYDLHNACDRCLSGGRLIRPFLASAKPLSRSLLAQTDCNLKLLSERAVEMVGRARIPVTALLPVVDEDSGESLPWYLLNPSFVLPRMLSESKGITRERPCETCGRDGHFRMTEIAYEPCISKDELADCVRGVIDSSIPEIAATWERFGIGSRLGTEEVRVAPPAIVVNQKLYRAVVNSGLPKLAWTPITLI